VPPEFAHVDNGISDGAKFVHLLTEVDLDAELVIYQVAAGEFPTSVAACDAYLITGSPASVYDDAAWISQLTTFVRDLHARQIPLIGICFGHQLIAQALGGRVNHAANGWHLGLRSFDVLVQPSWMTSQLEQVRLYHINHDQVTQLPPGAQLLGYSDACPNSMYMIGEHILCLQGHPEQPLRAMKNFIDELGANVPLPVREAALRSFEDAEPDRLLVGRWLRSFLEQHFLMS
jgi:GMP synthase-like glutamine amidotransferase